MKLRAYTVTGEQGLWVNGARFERGDEVRLPDHEQDALVALSVTAGVIELRKRGAGDDPERMTCPICAEHMKRPPKLEEGELAAHYEERHAGFETPDFEPDSGEADS